MKRLIFLLLIITPILVNAQTNLSNNLQPNTPKAIDNRYGVFSGGLWKPYINTTAVNTAISPFYRYLGLTVIVGTDSTSSKEYWYANGINDDKLVVKTDVSKADAFPIINAQTGTTYTLQVSDNTKIIKITNAGSITVTIPTSLGVGFNCLVVQGGAGVVTLSPSSTTLHGTLSTSAQYGTLSILPFASNEYIIK